MKKVFALSVCICFFFGLQVFSQGIKIPPKTHPDITGWPHLFRDDLSDADYPTGSWIFYKNVLYMNMGDCIWTKKEYTNFMLDLEFKTTRNANSGVIVHCSDMDNWIPNSVEIQIADESTTKSGEKWPGGSVYGHLLPSKQVLKPVGKWNHYTITCKDKMIWVILNGEQVIKMNMAKWTSNVNNPDGSLIPGSLSIALADMPLKGRIGLQGRFTGAIVYYRNIKIRELE